MVIVRLLLTWHFEEAEFEADSRNDELPIIKEFARISRTYEELMDSYERTTGFLVYMLVPVTILGVNQSTFQLNNISLLFIE